MNFEVIFDNGGSVTIQGEGFAVAYDSHSFTVRQAAQEARALLDGAEPTDWEGNSPENRMLDRRECKTYTADDLRVEMASGEPIDWRYKGASEREFIAALTGRKEEE